MNGNSTKTKIHILLLALAGLLWGLPVAVQAQSYTNSYGIWDYSPNNDNDIYGTGTCTISEYTGSSGAVIIPDTINGLTVVAIGNAGFYPGIFDRGETVTSVTIPDSVISIGIWAFYGCTNLTSVTIPGSVTNIGEGAFEDCPSLTNIVIPDSVTSIGTWAFLDCAKLTSVNIGNGVTYIEPFTFAYCTSLPSIAIPDSVTSIGGGYFHLYGTIGAFKGCSNLTSVIIGDGVTNIEDSAFDSCPALTSVFFQGNAPTADSTIFTNDNVANITVYYAPGTTGWDIFASTVGVVTAPEFGSTAYGGLPVLFYPPATNTLQWSTNLASGVWITVSNAVTMAALQLTNPPPSAFFRLQSSGSHVSDAGLAFYFGQPVLFYPANAAYSPQMATNLATANWNAPSGNAFITVQITNVPSGAVFRLH